MTTIPESALDFVKTRAEREWRLTHSRDFLSRLFRFLLRKRPVDVIYVEQYGAGDWASGRCQGKAVGAWKLDTQGFAAIDAVGELDRSSPIATATPVIRFHVDDPPLRMIYEEWHGGRAGYGAILRFDRSANAWQTERMAWRS